MLQKKYNSCYGLSFAIATIYCGIFSISLSWAEEFDYSYDRFGGIGLLDMPSARFSPDGMLAGGVYYDKYSELGFFTWQATPWLETTLSYTDNKQGNLGIDRSLNMKLRLWQESDYRPQLAIGIQDVLGAGSTAGEYLVASKRYYDFDFTLGFSWGYLGSRGGVANMFRLFGNGFDNRSTSASSGGIRKGSYFAGKDMSAFAGVEYHPPIEGLSLKIEYSGVDTRNITDLSYVKQKTSFNFGVNYKPVSWIDVAFGFDHGDHFGVRLTLRQNLHKLKLKKWFRDTEPSPIYERRTSEDSDESSREISGRLFGNDALFDRLRHFGAKIVEIEQRQDMISLKVKIEKDNNINPMILLGAVLESYDKVELHILEGASISHKYDATKFDVIGQEALNRFRKTTVYIREKSRDKVTPSVRRITAQAAYDELNKENLKPVSVGLENKKVEVRKTQGPYHSEARNIGRVARVLTKEMPDNIEEFKIISERDGLAISNVTLLRRDLEKANHYQSSPEEIWANTNVSDPQSNEKDIVADDLRHKPNLDWGIMPEKLTHFGGNDDGRFRGDLYATAFGSLQFNQHIKLSAKIRQYIIGDLDKIPDNINPDVPHVRSDIAHYAKEGRTALDNMRIDYTAQVGRDLYTRLTAGIIESMYGGFGAEILYRPYHHNFAFALDINWVKQRGYDQLFSFRDYETFTGHATFYHENENYNITSKLSVGRYLAGDYGATLDISRRFENGVRLGVWATVTDMSSQQFGSGSFDKGIYLTIPIEYFWFKPSREVARFNFRSLGKNGGQMLDRGDSLYDMLSSGRKNRLSYEWRNILD
ncbi:MAG: YjbH domain-containing protein [Emcibacter sp.]|nr:YjbH domain-containing protein [Emcibacter sp.]